MPIEVEGKILTSKGKQGKTYQTPYGRIVINRNAYQASTGGATYCPLAVEARIIIISTPRLAKQISHKYAEMSSVRLVEDLRENHGRDVHRSFVQTLVEALDSLKLGSILIVTSLNMKLGRLLGYLQRCKLFNPSVFLNRFSKGFKMLLLIFAIIIIKCFMLKPSPRIYQSVRGNRLAK